VSKDSETDSSKAYLFKSKDKKIKKLSKLSAIDEKNSVRISEKSDESSILSFSNSKSSSRLKSTERKLV
jgi:hypothetical protein